MVCHKGCGSGTARWAGGTGLGLRSGVGRPSQHLEALCVAGFSGAQSPPALSPWREQTPSSYWSLENWCERNSHSWCQKREQNQLRDQQSRMHLGLGRSEWQFPPLGDGGQLVGWQGGAAGRAEEFPPSSHVLFLVTSQGRGSQGVPSQSLVSINSGVI